MMDDNDDIPPTCTPLKGSKDKQYPWMKEEGKEEEAGNEEAAGNEEVAGNEEAAGNEEVAGNKEAEGNMESNNEATSVGTMSRHCRGSKCIGCPKRRTMHHTQTLPTQPSAAPLLTYALSFPPLQPCQFGRNFDHCECIVHEKIRPDVPAFVLSENYDTDGFSADEFYLIIGSSVQQYLPSENLDGLTLQKLRQDVIDKERYVNALGMNFARTTQKLNLVQFYEHESSVNIKLSVTVHSDLSPIVTVHGKRLSNSHPVYRNMKTIYTFSDLMYLLNSVFEYYVCAGNFEEEFLQCFSGKGKAYLDEYKGAMNNATIRANECTLLTAGIRCSACMAFRASLRSQRSRKRKSTETPVTVSSSKPNSSMTHAELLTKAKLLKAKNKTLELENKRLRFSYYGLSNNIVSRIEYV